MDNYIGKLWALAFCLFIIMLNMFALLTRKHYNWSNLVNLTIIIGYSIWAVITIKYLIGFPFSYNRNRILFCHATGDVIFVIT